MSKLDEWRSVETLPGQLAEILNHPVMAAALSVLREQSPANAYADIPAHNITGNGDAMAGKISGYELALKNLQRLAQAPFTKSTNIPEDKIEPTE